MTISKEVNTLVRTRAKHRCEYCQASEWLTGQRFHIDHIIPLAQGGDDDIENLCLACPACNGSKQDKIKASDPDTDEDVYLFNPRQNRWHDHFAWYDDGLAIHGLTPNGRATVVVLKLNRTLALSSRAVWVSVNRHPPQD